MDNILPDLEERMEKAIAALQKEFSGLRTGRASADLLTPVTVEAYGSMMPLNQVSTVSVSGARQITVQVWDAGLTTAVEKAISNSGLGLNPSSEGNIVRINLPELNEERRKELIKVVSKYAENGKVSIRNVRRDGMDIIKKAEKDNAIGEDESHDIGEEIQKLTDKMVAKIDELSSAKEEDIMKV